MDKQEVAEKTSEALSQISEAIGSAEDSHMLKLLTKPGSIGKFETWLGHVDAFSKASTALGVAGVGLQFALAVFGGESPEQKILKMVSALTKQVASFQKDVDNKFARLGVQVDKLAGEEEIFDHLNNIDAFQQATDAYWAIRCANKDGLAHARDVVLDFRVDKLRSAVKAIRKLTLGGPTNSNILDQVYTFSDGGDEVRQLGMCLLSHANAAPAIEAAYWSARYHDTPDKLPDVQTAITTTYGADLKDIHDAVTEAVRRCADFEQLTKNYRNLTTRFCSEQKGERWVTVGKQMFYEEVGDALILELSSRYPWHDWAVALYDGFSGAEWHGYKLSRRRMADAHPWLSLAFPNGGNLRVNLVVSVKEKGFTDRDPRDDAVLQKVVDSMPGNHTEGGSWTPYGSSREVTKWGVADVGPYLDELEQRMCAAFISIHLVRTVCVPCFRATDPQSIVCRSGPAFAGCYFI